MAELRWNPLLGTWTMVAPNRQKRPVVQSTGCPFCPGSGKVPARYRVLSYDNDFPALSPDPESLGSPAPEPYRAAAAYGKCEVILYSPDHEATLAQLPLSHIRDLVDLWASRFEALSADPAVKYVFPFENRGAEVGVTIHHPHGQLYAYPFVPLKVKVELDNCRAYQDEHARCLICDMNVSEEQDGSRIIAQSEHFISYLPYFTDYPYGVFIVPRRHVTDLAGFTSCEKDDLAAMLKDITGAFDTLFNKPFPYMMCVHQRPVNDPEYSGADRYYHFHIEFYPPLRDERKIKYYASSEMGAWAACNPLSVEDTASGLREALDRFKGM